MRAFLLAAAAAFSASAAAQDTTAPAPTPGATSCRTTERGIEYRAYLPDGRRFIYVSASSLRGVAPSVLILIDKNYDAPEGAKPGADRAVTAWWIDRTRPFVFSADKITARYDRQFSITSYIGNWFSSGPPKEVTVPIRGLNRAGGKFEGTGSSNINAYAFELRVDLPFETGDSFDITLPSVTYDGVTVTPPVLHFTRSDDDRMVSEIKC